MKKLLLSAVAIFAANFSFGQITLEHTFPEGERFNVYNVGSETLYYTSIANSNLIKIYNADLSLRKTVAVPLPENYNMLIEGNAPHEGLYTMSKHIFNTDDKYEFLIEASYYEQSTQMSYRKLLLINDEGSLIKDFHPNAGQKNLSGIYQVFHDSVSGKNKFVIGNSAPNTPTLESEYELYSLPTTELATKEVSYSRLSAFPIPTSGVLNIMNPRNGANKVEIFDAAGKLVHNTSFNLNEGKITVDVERLPKGVYIYKVGDLSSKFIKK